MDFGESVPTPTAFADGEGFRTMKINESMLRTTSATVALHMIEQAIYANEESNNGKMRYKNRTKASFPQHKTMNIHHTPSLIPDNSVQVHSAKSLPIPITSSHPPP
jgi:hypothetical protein